MAMAAAAMDDGFGAFRPSTSFSDLTSLVVPSAESAATANPRMERWFPLLLHRPRPNHQRRRLERSVHLPPLMVPPRRRAEHEAVLLLLRLQQPHVGDQEQKQQKLQRLGPPRPLLCSLRGRQRSSFERNSVPFSMGAAPRVQAAPRIPCPWLDHPNLPRLRPRLDPPTSSQWVFHRPSAFRPLPSARCLRSGERRVPSRRKQQPLRLPPPLWQQLQQSRRCQYHLQPVRLPLPKLRQRRKLTLNPLHKRQ